MGSDYLIQHCVVALSVIQEEQLYRIYMSDAIRVAVENLANVFGGSTLTKRYYEFIAPQSTTEDKRTEEEVVEHIQERLRLLR